jgi:outer membrane usher protein
VVFGLRGGVGVIALLLPGIAQAQSNAQPAPTPAIEERQVTPRPQRALSFTVPLVSASRAYGDVLIEVRNGTDVFIAAEDLARELDPVLNDQGREALTQALAQKTMVPLDDLRQAGFDLVFNSNRLELEVVGLTPQFRQVQSLIPSRDSGKRPELDRIEPAGFSTYLNFIGNFNYSTELGNENPELFLTGATRVGNVVAEYDGAFTDQFSNSYKFSRRSTRFVYDDPKSFRRYSAGDLRVETLSLLTVPQIAGLGVEKRRRIFEPGLSALRVNGRQIFLNNRSTVDVVVNGVNVESLQLDAGAYDLSTLPIQQGSNDIQLIVTDSFGQKEVISYDFFFESLPLEAGDEEYSIGVGVLADNLGFEPSYTSDPVASALYRRSLSENLILGGALQISEDIQVVGASVISVPQFIPGFFDLELAASTASGQNGFAVRAGYSFSQGGALTGANQFAVNISYQSEGFTSVNNLLPVNFDLLSLTATYSRSFGLDSVGTIGVSYFTGGNQSDDYALFADFSHRLNDKLRLTGGLEYGRSTDTRSAFGVRVGVALALGRGARASADVRTRFDNFRANLSDGAENEVGSFGYDVALSQFGDEVRSDAQLEYVANRFNARADLTSRGASFGNITQEQRIRVQVATAVAFAGGQFGIGRPINSAFLLAKPNDAIEGQDVITGRGLNSGKYYARSGPFGSALQGDLGAYTAQNVQFDAADPDSGFDVGDGTVLLEPPYQSGYAVIVGETNFVTVIGTLRDENGAVAVATGVVRDLQTGEVLEDSPFFTNAAGRFGVFGLAPGRSYEIRLSGSDRTFVLDIPKDTDPIIRLGPIALKAKE